MARKYKSSKKYSYKEGGKTKKIVRISMIVLIAILVVAAIAIALISVIAGGGDDGITPLSIKTKPDKTVYYVGESPSWYGLEAKLVTEAGSTVVLGPESCTITGFDSSKPAEKQVITVKYKDYTTTFTISIISKSNQGGDQGGTQGGTQDGTQGGNQQGGTQQQPAGQFNGLSFKSMPKTEYKVGDWLSVKGGVLLLKYDNGTTKEIDLNYDMVTGFTTAKPGTYTLTVVYIEDGVRATATYDITVTE